MNWPSPGYCSKLENEGRETRDKGDKSFLIIIQKEGGTGGRAGETGKAGRQNISK